MARAKTIADRQMWRLWMSIKQRCYNPNNKDYSRYGGRGITLDAEWLNFNKFFSDMGKMPDGMSLERIDNAKPYSKENCKWATRKEQANNRAARILQTHCIRGHEFTQENTRIYLRKDGRTQRFCKRCDTIRHII